MRNLSEATWKRRARTWMLDPERIHMDRQKSYPLGKPSAQDVEDILAVMEWDTFIRESRYMPENVASRVWCLLNIWRAQDAQSANG